MGDSRDCNEDSNCFQSSFGCHWNVAYWNAVSHATGGEVNMISQWSSDLIRNVSATSNRKSDVPWLKHVGLNFFSPNIKSSRTFFHHFLPSEKDVEKCAYIQMNTENFTSLYKSQYRVCYYTTPVKYFQNNFHYFKKNHCTHYQALPIMPPPRPRQLQIYLLSLDLPILHTSYKKSMCSISWLAYLIVYVFKVYSRDSMIQYSIPFYGWIIRVLMSICSLS